MARGGLGGRRRFPRIASGTVARAVTSVKNPAENAFHSFHHTHPRETNPVFRLVVEITNHGRPCTSGKRRATGCVRNSYISRTKARGGEMNGGRAASPCARGPTDEGHEPAGADGQA